MSLRLSLNISLRPQKVVRDQLYFNRTNLKLLGRTVILRLGITVVLLSSFSFRSLQLRLCWTLVLKVIAYFLLDLLEGNNVTASVRVYTFELHYIFVVDLVDLDGTEVIFVVLCESLKRADGLVLESFEVIASLRACGEFYFLCRFLDIFNSVGAKRLTVEPQLLQEIGFVLLVVDLLEQLLFQLQLLRGQLEPVEFLETLDVVFIKEGFQLWHELFDILELEIDVSTVDHGVECKNIELVVFLVALLSMVLAVSQISVLVFITLELSYFSWRLLLERTKVVLLFALRHCEYDHVVAEV